MAKVGYYKNNSAVEGDVSELETRVDSVETTLGGKANDSAVVHKTGNESIAGIKDFADLRENGLQLQPRDADLTAIGALDSTQSGALATDGSGWIRKTYAQLKTALGLTKGDVGLGNVDNTSDATAAAALKAATNTWSGANDFTGVLSQNSDPVVTRSMYFVDIRKYGAILDGDPANATVNATAINAAITEANAAGGGRVYAPYGGTAVIGSSINLKDNVHVDLPITIKPTAAVSSAVFLGTSGASVSDCVIDNPFMVIDGDFANTADTVAGIQITNGARITVDGIRIKNLGGSGVILQGLNASGGCPDSKVVNCKINDVGLEDSTTGFGVTIKDASTDCEVSGNILRGIKGGMGIGGNGSSGTGYPLRLGIYDNDIHMAPSTTGFEAIGITAGCDYAVIKGNRIRMSYDNGISASAAYATVAGNMIDGCYNHGIHMGGDYSVAANNVVLNAGQETLQPSRLGENFGGLEVASADHVLLISNIVRDDQATPTMAHGVKFNSSQGNNRALYNIITGQTDEMYFGAISTDMIVDINTTNLGPNSDSVYADNVRAATSGGPINLRADTLVTNRVSIGNSPPTGGQFMLVTNTTTRPTIVVQKLASQTSDFLTVRDTDGSTVLAQWLVSGAVVSPNVRQSGVQAKSANYTTVATDSLILATGGASGITITLLAGAPLGQRVEVKKVDAGAGAITVSGGSATIDGSSTRTIANRWESETYVSDGTNWVIT